MVHISVAVSMAQHSTTARYDVRERRRVFIDDYSCTVYVSDRMNEKLMK